MSRETQLGIVGSRRLWTRRGSHFLEQKSSCTFTATPQRTRKTWCGSRDRFHHLQHSSGIQVNYSDAFDGNLEFLLSKTFWRRFCGSNQQYCLQISHLSSSRDAQCRSLPSIFLRDATHGNARAMICTDVVGDSSTLWHKYLYLFISLVNVHPKLL